MTQKIFLGPYRQQIVDKKNVCVSTLILEFSVTDERAHRNARGGGDNEGGNGAFCK